MINDDSTQPLNPDGQNPQYVERPQIIETHSPVDRIFNFAKTTSGFILLFIFSFGFNTTFIILFRMNIYNGVDYESLGCAQLVKWDNALYINLSILLTCQIIRFVLNLKSSSKEESSGFLKLIINVCSLIEFVIFIGVQFIYYKLDVEQCDPLGTITFAYILATYCYLTLIIVIPCIIFCGACCIAAAIISTQPNQAN